MSELRDEIEKPDQIEVTDEMIRGGVLTALEMGLHPSHVEAMVEVVYLKMEEIRRDKFSRI